MKISRDKEEHMSGNVKEAGGKKMQVVEVVKVDEFKYLKLTIQNDGHCTKEVKEWVRAGWSEWKRVSGLMCDRRTVSRMKRIIYKTVVRPNMMYCMKTVVLSKTQEIELNTVKMNMLRFLFSHQDGHD